MIICKCIRCTIKAWCIRKAIPIREFGRRAVGRRGLDRRRGFGFRGGFDFTVYYYS
jgi:hypothetical protein